MRNDPPLPEQRLSGPVFVARPAPPKSVTAESPALDVMTDLRYTQAALIEPQASMAAAHGYMVQRGVGMLLVLGPDRSLAGIISASDISGEKPRGAHQERGVGRNEILVSDMMTPLDRLAATSIADVKNAKVGEIIASLRNTGRQHSLVTETFAHGKTDICGIFSLAQIERQLGMAMQSAGMAAAFAEPETTSLPA
jgi:hypothetical protein